MIFQKSFQFAEYLLNKHLLIVSMLKTSVVLNTLVENVLFLFLLFQMFLMNRKNRKELNLFEIEIFFNIFTVTFNTF